MTLAHLKALLADPEAGLDLAAAAVNALPALLAVVEAAQDEALFWNEAYCNGPEYELLSTARNKLHAALTALDATGKGE